MRTDIENTKNRMALLKAKMEFYLIKRGVELSKTYPGQVIDEEKREHADLKTPTILREKATEYFCKKMGVNKASFKLRKLAIYLQELTKFEPRTKAIRQIDMHWNIKVGAYKDFLSFYS